MRLHNEASMANVSLSTIANRMFQRYLEFDIPASKAGFAYVTKRLVGELVSLVPYERTSFIAKNVASPDFVDLTSMMTSKTDPDSLIESILRMTEYSGYGYREFYESGTRTIVLNHGLGMKFGVFFAEMIEHSFRQAGTRLAQCEGSSSILVIKLEDSKRCDVIRPVQIRSSDLTLSADID